MPLAALVCFGLLGMADGSTPPPDVAAAYEQAKASAGRLPGDQVRLALWCESHGLTVERARHLTLALLADPTNTAARGLAGLVARDGRWVAPDRVAETVQTDAIAQALLADYDQKRSKTPYTADAQWALGQWADEQGLTDQARAHFTAVTRLDPSRDLAWKRLGYKKHDGRWTTDAQLAADRAELDAQKAADRTWKAQFEKWKGMLAQPSREAEARAGLLGVTDPRAVPSILRVFGTDRPTDQRVAAGLLGQITAPQASRALAALAVFSPTADVRRVAVETLRRRDPRDFVGFWISLIRQPIEYEVQPVGGPGSPGALFVRGSQANTQRIYRPMNAPSLANHPGAVLTDDGFGSPVLVEATLPYRYGYGTAGSINQIGPISGTALREQLESSASLRSNLIDSIANPAARAALDKIFPNAAQSLVDPWKNFPGGNRGELTGNYNPIAQSQIRIPIGEMMRDAQRSALVAQTQLKQDIASLESANAAIHKTNEPVLNALRDATGQDLGEDGPRWDRWWTDQLGYASQNSSTTPTPTFVQNVPIGFAPTAAPIITTGIVGYVAERRHSCFGAGTPVRTIDGAKPVETIQRGDLVLTQNTHSGALSYQPVLTAFHNPPSPTYRIKLGDEAVVATGIHRFWKAGRGWVMARDIQVGDSLRILGGVATVDAVEPNQTEPVFNLEVAAGGSFFVGHVGALVHDNSLVEATPNPFDSADLVAAKGRTSP